MILVQFGLDSSLDVCRGQSLSSLVTPYLTDKGTYCRSWKIMLPFNRTVITIEVVSKVVSHIIGSCCRSISLICKVFKGIIKYFSLIIHNISMNFIIWQCKDIIKYNGFLHYCSVNAAMINPPTVGQYTK